MKKNKKELTEEELDDLLDHTYNKQNQIHPKCEIRDDPKRKQKEWNEKYG